MQGLPKGQADRASQSLTFDGMLLLAQTFGPVLQYYKTGPRVCTSSITSNEITSARMG